jgi:hypothetical protein
MPQLGSLLRGCMGSLLAVMLHWHCDVPQQFVYMLKPTGFDVAILYFVVCKLKTTGFWRLQF